MEATKKRKANWAQSEIDELRNSFLEFRSIVDGRLGISLTNSDKERTWRMIQERVNAQSRENRTLDEMKKKLSDLKSGVKKRERDRCRLSNQTGGGPAPKLLEWEEKMLEAIGEVAVNGFVGTDTFQSDTLGQSQAEGSASVEHVTCENSTPSTEECTFAKKRKTKDSEEDDRKGVMVLLQDNNRLLGEILEQQKQTNKILSTLFAVNVEP